MSDLYDLLKKIEKTPAMYVGGQSLFLLESFMNGYVLARDELNIPSTDRENDFFDNFHNWLQQRLDVKTTKSWSSIIFFRSFSEKNALKNFFYLLEEFINRNKKLQYLTEDSEPDRETKST
jgi:hypothetical protein